MPACVGLSTPSALTSAIEQASDGRPVDIIVESTAMTWFVAGVAAERSGVEHTLHRVSGRKAAALRTFYRAHTKTDRIDAPLRKTGRRLNSSLRRRLTGVSGLMADRFVFLRW